MVLLRNIDSQKSALTRANVLLESLQEEFVFEGNSRSIKASFGISIYPHHGVDYTDLLSKADAAMYISKQKGKNVVSIYQLGQ